jgi:hypothetical protein
MNAVNPRGPNFFDDDNDFSGEYAERMWGESNMIAPRILRELRNTPVRVACRAQSFMDNGPHMLQRNAAKTKDFTRKVPKPIVVVVNVNEHETRALLDSGSLGDFMSTTIADQIPLEKPLAVQLAVQGSRTRANFGTKVRMRYQDIDSARYFDIINLDGYDLILGTPFMFQHKVMMGFNDPKVIIGSAVPLRIQGMNVAVLSSMALDQLKELLERARRELRAYASPVCKKAMETDLPPLRKINHRIPLIDPEKVYSCVQLSVRSRPDDGEWKWAVVLAQC